MENRENNCFSAVVLGALLGFSIGLLLKEEEKKKILAFLKEKMETLGKEVKDQAKEIPSSVKPLKKELKKRFFVRKENQSSTA